MSDYTQRVREFAQLNPDQWVPDTNDPVIFQAVARTLEEDQALSDRVMYDLTLGENVRDVGRGPAARAVGEVTDRERYYSSRMAAVTQRARAAQRTAVPGHLDGWQRRWGLPDPPPAPTGERDAGPAAAERTPRQGVER